MVIDADPQGSLALWHSLRADHALPLATAERGIDRALTMAMVGGYDWVFIDTAPTMWVVVHEAIRAATLVVIPARRASSISPPCARPSRSRASATSRMRWCSTPRR
jgi:chromosome partitioning protein